MKKRWIACLLALALAASMFCLPAFAYTKQNLNTADALYKLGLFKGTGKTYALDRSLTRNEGITLLVRMLGKEKEANDGKFTHPFTDVAEWAAPYVGYAFTNSLTKGVSGTLFGGERTMSDQMFLTIVLRALGYTDGKDGDFQYDSVWAFAKEVGLSDSDKANPNFSRGDAVEAFWKALELCCTDTKDTLAHKLIGQGVFTQAQYDAAIKIRKDGRGPNDGTGELQSATPGALTAEMGTESAPSGEKEITDKPQNPQTPDKPSSDTGKTTMTWAQYNALSKEEQKAFYESFKSYEEFNEWRKQAKAEAAVKPVITDGTIDIGS